MVIQKRASSTYARSGAETMMRGIRSNYRVSLPIVLAFSITLIGCTTTETVSRSPSEQVQQQRVNQSQTQAPARTNTPSLSQLTYQNAEFHLIVNRTTMSDVQRWWGQAHGRGYSGEFLFLNYTDVVHDRDKSRMLMMTLYFSAQGVLQDYDLQIHEFSK